MSNHHKKTIKKSEGVLQESSITSQGDVQVGNREISNTKNSHNSFQFIFNGSKWLILGLPFAVLLWFAKPRLDTLGHGDGSDSQTEVLDTSVVTTTTSQPPAPSTTNKPATKTSKDANSKSTPPLQKETSSQIVVGVKFVETDGALANVLFEAYHRAFKPLDVLLIKASGAIPYQWELSCTFNPTYTLAELNGEFYEVDGLLEVTLYDLKQQRLLGTASEKVYFSLRDKAKTSQGLKQILEEINLLEDLVPNNIL